MAAATVSGTTPKTEKPNIIFFITEDLSRACFELYCGAGAGARTPVLEEMADHGIVFNNAYSCAPVSSAARSTVITGCYAPTYGLSSHRKLSPVTLPENIRLFPYYLKKAGYHTTNASKTDYNCMMDEAAWDIVKGKLGDWRARPSSDQPFFHCFSINACHESCLHFPVSDMETVVTEHDPSQVHLYPFHPDTELFRYTYLRLYDKISHVDSILGKMIKMLKADGLIDNTFIFYMGDNGGCLPFSKGYTNELGMNVPLVVYVPENWREDISFELGEKADGFVNFMDLAPTVLNLAGIEIPEYMDGQAFLGKNVSTEDVEARNIVLGYGDRFDELYATNRTVRKGNYKYSRNFMPWQPKGLYCSYRYIQAAFRQWRELFDAGKLNDVQSAFFRPQGSEELYDLSVDPYETVNLADNPEYNSVMAELRDIMKDTILENEDLVLIPEAIWSEHAKDMETYKQSVRKKLKKYYDVAQLQIIQYDYAEKKLKKALVSDDPVIRYWGISAACGFGEKALSLKSEIADMLDDDFSVVASRAALYCIANGIGITDNIYHKILASAENDAATLMILNDMAFLFEDVPGFRESISKKDLKFFPNPYSGRLKFFHKCIENK